MLTDLIERARTRIAARLGLVVLPEGDAPRIVAAAARAAAVRGASTGRVAARSRSGGIRPPRQKRGARLTT